MTDSETTSRKRKAMRRKVRSKIDRQPMETVYGFRTIDTKDVSDLIEVCPEKVFVLDTETTGLSSSDDDVLELSIINGLGNTVYSKRLEPWAESWDEAQRIHGISPEDVRGCPRLEEEAYDVTRLLAQGKAIVGYNVFFDIWFLNHAGVFLPNAPICDVMDEFSNFYGEWVDWADGGYGGFKWQKLTTAGRYYKVDTRGAHGSLKDCQITLEVLKKLSKEPFALRHRERPEEGEE